MKVALFGKQFSEDFLDSFKLILDEFNSQKIELCIYRPFYDFVVNDLGFTPNVSEFFSKHSDLDKEAEPEIFGAIKLIFCNIITFR